MLSHASGFTCASAFLVDWVRGRRPGLDAEVLYSPVAIAAEEHVVRLELSRSVRERFPGRHILVYVGTISRIYQVEEILDLAGELRSRRRDVVVLICGEGPDRKIYEAQATKRGLGDVVHFEGRIRRQDVASYLDASSVLLFPFHENRHNLARCPTKGFHYAAANRPLVTNRVGEVAKLFGGSACYYPERDVRAMADASERAIALSSAFDNGIPFRELTWAKRADSYEDWFERMKIW
jgi:glycosyltransferase involved in cell wall biosynthesis